MSHGFSMQAEPVRARWLLVASGALAAALALALPGRSVAGMPPVVDAEVALAPQHAMIFETARCVAFPVATARVIEVAAAVVVPELLLLDGQTVQLPPPLERVRVHVDF